MYRFAYRSLRSLSLLLAFAVSAGSFPGRAAAGEFYENEGIAGFAQTLRRLGSGVRVLHIAAHPDDEDSALVARLSLGDGARVTYLSLSRGEGGQNLIGPEMFEDLGVLRTAELMAARRLDGAGQLFGRQIDFGFSKTPEETFSHWPRQEVVRDIVRAIRRTRPHIVTCRFSGTALDGHGQHQVSVLATREAIEAAADFRRFPELRELGLEPWTVQKFYTGLLSGSDPGAVEVPTDVYDPWVGRSLGAVGYAGRSMHRSQDMGMIEFEESRPAVLKRERPPLGPRETELEILAGLNVEHPRLRSRAAEMLLRPRALNDPMILARDLALLLRDWRREAPAEVEAIRDLEQALAVALGLRIEAFADASAVHPGGSVTVACRALLPLESEIDRPRWGLRTREDLVAAAKEGAVEGLRADFSLTAKENARPSLPYFLVEGRDSELYRWPRADWAGDAFEAPAAVAVFTARHQGETFSLTVPVEFRHADPAYGEIREDLAVLPRVSVTFDPPSVRVANGQALIDKSIAVVAENRSDQPLRSSLLLFNTESPNEVPIALEIELEAGQVRRFPLILSDAALQGSTRRQFSARWREPEPGNPESPAYRVDKLDYRHIRPRVLCRPSLLEIHRLDVTLPAGLRVGYVRGPGETVGDILRELGADVVFLEPDDLAKGDLSGFDAIVTGARAYEVRPDLVENNSRLLNYAREGGTLIVQYNKYSFAEGNLAPLPMSFARPHDRVTDERAKIEVLRPQHPIFQFPNAIRPKDFDGWIQERGLYFWSTWDPAFVALMASADPGEAKKQGGMLYLKLGKGHYVYTGYAFFRQLPEGVEGATRLFANLVSLGRSPGRP
jgi:LmbE family N-acetylglucosaminyl deacetylase